MSYSSSRVGCDFSVAPASPAVVAGLLREEFRSLSLTAVLTGINRADVSEQKKNEAKTLLRKLLSSKAAVSVLGPGAQSLAAKYFTE